MSRPDRLRTLSRLAAVAACTFVPLWLGCSRTSQVQEASGEPDSQVAKAGTPKGVPEPTLELGAVTKGSLREHAAGYAWTFDAGDPAKIHLGEAEARGYTIIDLSNDWAPYIFSEKTAGLDDELPNQYRSRYLDLASNRTDSDGDALPSHRGNHLELYGIPPTLAVLLGDWQKAKTEVEPCLEKAGYDPTVFAEFKGTIAYRKKRGNKNAKKARWFKSQLGKKARRLGLELDSPEGRVAIASHPKTKSLYKLWRQYQGPVDVIDHAQRRFRCERLYNRDAGRGTFKSGVFDFETTIALANFEKKHDIMGWGHFKKENLAALARLPGQGVYERLVRTIEERTTASAGILEDGSAASWKRGFRWRDSKGKEHELRNLTAEATQAVLDQLGLGALEPGHENLARLSDLGAGEFQDLLVAVKLPALPEYYSDNMKLSAVIDRGDVWYDFPYDEEGNKQHQGRKRRPKLTLYVEHLDQRIPLVHWGTTIGSWRNEIHEGETALKYKNSDVGARVWKHIVAAPVWIPPKTTPVAELIKKGWKNGKFRTRVDYAETGPGYQSAYGLVAAYHIRQVKDADGNVLRELDNSIRTHGSVDYMSILRRFSHGCHRLYNQNAVRMFSFILLRREYQRIGQEKIGYGRAFEHEERSFRMRLTTRGYKYELVEPIPVMVTQGRIRGRRRSPIEQYMKKPGAEEEGVDQQEGSDPAVAPAVPPTVPF